MERGRFTIPEQIIIHVNMCRLGYGVWLLTEIVEQQPKSVKIYLMYDIACTLVRHLKVCIIMSHLRHYDSQLHMPG